MKKSILYVFSCFVLLAGFASCSDDDAVTLPIVGVTIDNQLNKQEVMVGSTVELTANVADYQADQANQTISYNWTLNGESVSTQSSYTFAPTEPGTYTVALTVTTALQGEASASIELSAYGKYKYGMYVLSEGAVMQGDKGGYLTFISPEGEVSNMPFQTENSGAWLGSCPQDLFIYNGKMYIVTQNGGNEGGFLTIVNAETLKMGAAYEEEISAADNTWPTHVAVLADDAVYFRGNSGISLLNPQTKEVTFVEGSDGARKNTMAVADGKLFASQDENLLVIEAGQKSVAHTITFDSDLSGVIKSSDGNLWVSLSSGKIAKVNAQNYSVTETHDIAATNADAANVLKASYAAAPSITAKGDTLYMSTVMNNFKIYRHIFSTSETKLMVDVKDMVENANIMYNTAAVDPETGYVYVNTIKGYGQNVTTNQITAFDFSGDTPAIHAAYNNYTRFPAGTFFTANFR